MNSVDEAVNWVEGGGAHTARERVLATEVVRLRDLVQMASEGRVIVTTTTTTDGNPEAERLDRWLDTYNAALTGAVSIEGSSVFEQQLVERIHKVCRAHADRVHGHLAPPTAAPREPGANKDEPVSAVGPNDCLARDCPHKRGTGENFCEGHLWLGSR